MLAFDVLLCGAMIVLTVAIVTARAVFQSVVSFIGLGMLMALTWSRLGSANLALAEAAIGAGFTGSLLLSACHTIAPSSENKAARQPLLFAICLAGGGLTAATMFGQLPAANDSAAEVASAIASHPFGNAVTAVILDFRAYDTLLEMVVLLLALLGTNLLLSQKVADLHPVSPVSFPLVTPLLSLQISLLVLMALYLFEAGSSRPGGGFQAGALLAALGIVLRLTGHLVPVREPKPVLRLLVVAGLAAFSLVASVSVFNGDALLTYPGQVHLILMLGVEFAVMLSTAVTLVLLFDAVPGLKAREPR